MNCRNKRGIYELISVFTCENCVYNKNDVTLKIGKTSINIYYTNINCKLYNDLEKYFNQKIKLFLKDCIINNNVIYLWIDSFNIERNYDLLEVLLEFNLDIHILTD